ncbi:hypothetical protein [Bifidobacterium breve]|uniref:hypothetical protein n=1 Tax=Bifidobacterium breve TaxID=1685 RepID=UPI003D092AE0
MTRKIQLSPSLMTMDLDQFKEQITFLNDKVNSFHIDVMDGHFVPNITLSLPGSWNRYARSPMCR